MNRVDLLVGVILMTGVIGSDLAGAAVAGWYQTGSAVVSGPTDAVDVSFVGDAGQARTEVTARTPVGSPLRLIGRAQLGGEGARAVIGVQMFTADWQGVSDQRIDLTNPGDQPFTLGFTRPGEAAHVRVYARKLTGSATFLQIFAFGITAATDPRLPYAPPVLDNPTTLSLGTGFTTNRLDPKRDYVIELPKTKKIGGTQLIGGRNVVIIGGHVTIPKDAPAGDSYHRGLYIKDATGTVHVEGLLIDGFGGGESDAIAIAAPAATVQLQNVRLVDITGTHSTWHADLVQPWGGVKELRIHNLTGSSHYQGLQIPTDLGPVGRSRLSNINLKSLGEQTKESGGQLLWIAHGCVDHWISLERVYVQPRPTKPFAASVYPGGNQSDCPFVTTTGPSGAVTGRWPNLRVTGEVTQGAPPDGDFVPAGEAGIAYVSPGYRL